MDYEERTHKTAKDKIHNCSVAFHYTIVLVFIVRPPSVSGVCGIFRHVRPLNVSNAIVTTINHTPTFKMTDLIKDIKTSVIFIQPWNRDNFRIVFRMGGCDLRPEQAGIIRRI